MRIGVWLAVRYNLSFFRTELSHSLALCLWVGRMSGEEGFEEWDADFLDQLIQVEELALSSKPAPPPCYYPSSSHLDVSHSPYESHSPPPLLSQRLIPDAPHEDPRDLQLQRLKVRVFISPSKQYSIALETRFLTFLFG